MVIFQSKNKQMDLNTCLIKHECKSLIHTCKSMDALLDYKVLWGRWATSIAPMSETAVQCLNHLQWAGWRWGVTVPRHSLPSPVWVTWLWHSVCLTDCLADWLKRFQLPCTTFTLLPAICHDRFFSPKQGLFNSNVYSPRFHFPAWTKVQNTQYVWSETSVGLVIIIKSVV